MRRMIHRAIATIGRWLERCEIVSLLHAEEIQQAELIEARRYALTRQQLCQADADYWQSIIQNLDGDLEATRFFITEMRSHLETLRIPAPTSPVQYL